MFGNKKSVTLSLSLMCCALLLQQLVVASSSVWIRNFTDNIDNPDLSFYYLLLFFISLTLPHIFGAISTVFLQLFDTELFTQIVSLFSNSFAEKIQIYNNKQARSNIESTLTQEVRAYSNDFTTFIYNFAAASMSVLFNVVTIGIFIDAKIASFFVLGFILSSVTLWSTSGTNSKHSLLALNARLDIQNSLLRFWDNNIIGNKSHSALWKSHTNSKIAFWKKKEINRALVLQSIMVLSCLCSILPFTIYFLVQVSQNNFTKASLLVYATLFYRFFQVIISATFLYNVVAQISNIKSRFKELKSKLNAQHPMTNITDQIKPEKIFYQSESSLQKQCVKNTDAFISFLKNQKTGRIFISGENGSGKTCLMLLLKQTLNGTYLPAIHHLETTLESDGQGSTGQIQSRHLSALLESDEITPLLLDEWAANLDSVKRDVFQKLISQSAESRLIIEVGHGS